MLYIYIISPNVKHLFLHIIKRVTESYGIVSINIKPLKQGYQKTEKVIYSSFLWLAEH